MIKQRSMATIECIRCPNCGIDIYPPEDVTFKFVSKEKLREYTRRYENKKKQVGDHHD